MNRTALNEPRRHHILPVFYLAGFTNTGDPDNSLFVHDYFRSRRYRARPAQVANERDFYRVYEPDEDPFVIERDLARVEGEIAAVLRRVRATGVPRGPEDLGTLLSLAALIHARGRKARDRLSQSMQKTMEEKLRAGQVTEEQWQKLTESEVRAGVPRESIPSLQEAKRLVWIGAWRPRAPEVLKTGLIAETQRIVFDALVGHTWSIARATADSGGFICSDTPLAWGRHDPWSPDGATERLDDAGQVVTFPLSRDLALITRDDGRRGTYEAVPRVVAWVNARTHLGSLGMLYSAAEDFLLEREGGIGHAADYFAYVETMRRLGVVNP